MAKPLDSFYQDFITVCSHGYQALGYTRSDSPLIQNQWQSSAAFPPSYGAMGRYRILETLRLAQSVGARRILEVAAGGGFMSACLASGADEVWLNDLRPTESLDHWVHGDKMRWIEGDLFDLKFDKPFDLVVAAEVLEHAAHGDRLIHRLFDYTKPGGTVLITTPNGDNSRSNLPTYSQLTEQDRINFESEQFKPDADGHLFLYTTQEITTLLEAAGFENVSVTLSVTPFISGQCGLRFLPQLKVFAPIYVALDRFFLSVSDSIARKWATQLIATARRPH